MDDTGAQTALILGGRSEIGTELAVRLAPGNLSLQSVFARADPRLHWRSQLYLGHGFKSRNNWRLARRNFEEALQSVPPAEDQAKKELFFQLAQGCADAGELADAINFGHELANLDFGFRDISRLLDEWQTRLDEGRKT